MKWICDFPLLAESPVGCPDHGFLLVNDDYSAEREVIRPPWIADPFVLRERWFDVSVLEFEAFLRDYPRPLEARPPLSRKANFREWVDLSIGAWPGNAVGKSWRRGACLGYQIRLDLVLKVSAQERWNCQWCD